MGDIVILSTRRQAVQMTHSFPVSSYSEAAYFDGNHCAHCAARDENLRLRGIAKTTAAMIERRTGSRGIRR